MIKPWKLTLSNQYGYCFNLSLKWKVCLGLHTKTVFQPLYTKHRNRRKKWNVKIQPHKPKTTNCFCDGIINYMLWQHKKYLSMKAFYIRRNNYKTIYQSMCTKSPNKKKPTQIFVFQVLVQSSKKCSQWLFKSFYFHYIAGPEIGQCQYTTSH